MAIRLSGMSSNMDTESMVKALVSGYSVNKDNLVKAQKKLSWKQDSWKSMNTKIYSFYSKTLTNMKLSATYSKKSASISDATLAKVSSSTSAVNGSQSLLVKNLASSGYLTGAKISKTDGSNLSLTSKITDVSGLASFAGGKFEVGTTSGTKTVELTPDMTINSLVTKLKDAGVNASFDPTNQRFFISAKTSGESNDFTLTAADSNGITALKSLGVFTVNAADTEKYTTWANYTPEEITAVKASTYEAAKTNYDKVSAEYKSTYDTALKNHDGLTAENVTIQKQIDTLTASKDGLSPEDVAAVDKKIADFQTKMDTNTASIATYDKTMQDTDDYVIFDTDTTQVKADKKAAIEQKVVDKNLQIQTDVNNYIDTKIAASKAALLVTGSAGAIRNVGEDSEITLNGATYTSNTNNYSINGLTIQALSESKTETPATITTDTDVNGIYDMIKGFFKEYNDLVNAVDASYNATSSKGYEPLTDDEKDKMSDTEVDKWEQKIKDSLLRKDETLGALSNAVKTDMAKSFEVNGQKISLSTYGINTLSYFKAATNERGAYHIDGNPDDSSTSGNADKLKAAIANDPDSVVNFFTQLSSSMYKDLSDRMKSSSMRSAYTVYNDKQMAKEYSEYTTKISDQATKVSTMEEFYYKKFTAMEKALSKMNSNSSSLTGMLK